jgi:hypothetical protein
MADACVGLSIGLKGLGDLAPLPPAQIALIVAVSAACCLTVNDAIKAALIRTLASGLRNRHQRPH